MAAAPDDAGLFMRRDESQGIIEFNTTEPGEYRFIFANLDDAGVSIEVSFGLHTFEEDKEEPIKYDFNDATGERTIRDDYKEEESPENILKNIAEDADIGNVKDTMRKVLKYVRNLKAETKLSMTNQESHNE